MIVYKAKKFEFDQDVDSGMISDKIKQQIFKIYPHYNNPSEEASWKNSTQAMFIALNDSEISGDLMVAIEYQIPLTSKRVDFILAGMDDSGNENVVIIELKQWTNAEKTDKEGVVITYLGGGRVATTHPSYQAYSYAKTIENFNEYVQTSKIELTPCAYLHNYEEKNRSQLENDFYSDFVSLAPVFLQNDRHKLREFIKRHVKYSSSKDIMYEIDNGKIKPSIALQDALASMIEGNKEFVMIDEQQVAFATIKDIIHKSMKSRKKHTVIVEGGPGTGKSVIAINLLAEFKKYNINYVTKNAAPRNVFFEKLKGAGFKTGYVKNLFKGSGAYLNSTNNLFDCLLIDEAHRLNEKTGLFGNLGENQIKELIHASLVSVFFIDEDQKVTMKDIGSIDDIKFWAKKLDSTIIYGPETKLVSQFRCNGSEGYIAWLDHVLGIRDTANFKFDFDYDLRIFDDPNIMREELKKINEVNNKARMVAGYCYNWVTKGNSDENIYDINLKNGFKAKWNFTTTNTWAIDKDSFEQIGCIHTSQGLEFDYIGVIIGKDLYFSNERVQTNYLARAKTDASLYGVRSLSDKTIASTIIKNTYKTLLSRGQKGCFVYCENEELSDYLKKTSLQ